MSSKQKPSPGRTKKGKKGGVNPCRQKGLLAGGSHPGRYYKRDGEIIKIPACECSQAFLNFGFKNLRFSHYEQDLAAAKGPGSLIRRPISKTSTDSIKRSTVKCVTPCDGAFRFRDSRLTKVYKRSAGKLTKFTGCQNLEEDLIDDALIKHEPDEVVGLSMEVLTEGLSREEPYPWHDPRRFVFDSLEASRYQRELVQRQNQYESQAQKARSQEISPASNTLSDLIRAAPMNWRQSHVRELYNSGHFNDLDPKLKLTAYLVCRNITEQDLVELIAPGLKYQEFIVYQSKVHAEIDKTMPPLAKRFKAFWAVLTKKQRQALEAYYMDTAYGSTSKKEIAQKLRISVDSLEDRLKGALKKLKEQFPEMKPLTAEDYKEKRRIHQTPDRQMDGFYFRSKAKKGA